MILESREETRLYPDRPEARGPSQYYGFFFAFRPVLDPLSDPALVARTALLNAASVAGLMLTTDVLVTELKDDDLENVVAGAVA